MSQLDAEINSHGHLATHTAAFASTLAVPVSAAAAVPGVASSIAAIASAADKLRPLLWKAQMLRARKQPTETQDGKDSDLLCRLCVAVYIFLMM